MNGAKHIPSDSWWNETQNIQRSWFIRVDGELLLTARDFCGSDFSGAIISAQAWHNFSMLSFDLITLLVTFQNKLVPNGLWTFPFCPIRILTSTRVLALIVLLPLLWSMKRSLNGEAFLVEHHEVASSHASAAQNWINSDSVIGSWLTGWPVCIQELLFIGFSTFYAKWKITTCNTSPESL